MATNQIQLKGVLIQGHQVASGKGVQSPYPAGTIYLQKPFFKKLGLDLSNLFEGTLNVWLPCESFKILNPDFCFENVTWIEGFNQETFSFVKCQVEYQGNQYSGWVYYPHPETKTQHFQQQNLIEILAPYIPNIVYGDELALTFQTERIAFFAPK
ncbi:hypothetical protein [Aliiglaciecola lipolytica]|uniref:Uncharacterized protein n=1 Tax=Aliiglaciecola lipolytica E3 TaxID=1127673 RepID=K6YQS3_9ALTE|nr:hypothetical protein [Aliiglaciecola lipolytica]GAC13675.1 hypothetical protein GLIP_1033 [Aliiglaciecola lipolytica E3]